MRKITKNIKDAITTSLIFEGESSWRIYFEDDPIPLGRVRICTKKEDGVTDQRVYGIKVDGKILSLRRATYSRQLVLTPLDYHLLQEGRLEMLFNGLTKGKEPREINSAFANPKDIYAHFCFKEQ